MEESVRTGIAGVKPVAYTLLAAHGPPHAKVADTMAAAMVRYTVCMSTLMSSS